MIGWVDTCAIREQWLAWRRTFDFCANGIKDETWCNCGGSPTRHHAPAKTQLAAAHQPWRGLHHVSCITSVDVMNKVIELAVGSDTAVLDDRRPRQLI